MNFIGFLVILILAVFTVASPINKIRTYSIATGRGTILRPGFDSDNSNYVKRSVNTDSPTEENEEDLINYEKRSLALGRAFFRPARSMAVGRVGFRPGKRSIATGRAGFRPGKRSTNVDETPLPLKDAEKLLLLHQILEDAIAENENLLKQFS